MNEINSYRGLKSQDLALLSLPIERNKDRFRLGVFPVRITSIFSNEDDILFDVQFQETENIKVCPSFPGFVNISIGGETVLCHRLVQICIKHYLDRFVPGGLSGPSPDYFSGSSIPLIYPMDKFDHIKDCVKNSKYSEVSKESMLSPFVQVFDHVSFKINY